MSQVDCNGSETGLYHCPSTSIGTQSCEKGIAAGIICNTKYGKQQPPTKTFFSVQFRHHIHFNNKVIEFIYQPSSYTFVNCMLHLKS